MSDKKIEIGDQMVESQLIEKSDILHISICELIDRYIMRGLYNEDYYDPPKRTRTTQKGILSKLFDFS